LRSLHENAVFVLLGYVLAPIETGKHISDDWQLFINFNLKNQNLRLTEDYFMDGTIASTLFVEIERIDPDWKIAPGQPVLVDARTNETLPLGPSYGAVFQTPEQRLSSVRSMLEGAVDDGPSLDTVMRTVFTKGH
jgi:hypothetical protein